MRKSESGMKEKRRKRNKRWQQQKKNDVIMANGEK